MYDKDTSWRIARIFASDIHEHDQVQKDKVWLTVIAKPIKQVNKMLIVLEGQDNYEEYGREEPVLARWQVPSTTYEMRKDNRR